LGPAQPPRTPPGARHSPPPAPPGSRHTMGSRQWGLSSEEAEARFKLCGEALEVLGDVHKRALYDQVPRSARGPECAAAAAGPARGGTPPPARGGTPPPARGGAGSPGGDKHAIEAAPAAASLSRPQRCDCNRAVRGPRYRIRAAPP
jgi:curved DNA-binding protein CbpA